MKETDIAWLAGIIDADGWILVHVGKRKSTGFIGITIRLGINMIDKNGVMDKIKRIYDTLGVTYNTNYKNKSTGIYIDGIKDIQKICSLMLPYMTVKRDRAEIIQNLPGKRISSNRFHKVIFVNELIKWAEIVDKLHNMTDYTQQYKWTGDSIIKETLKLGKERGYKLVNKSFGKKYRETDKRSEYTYEEVESFL